MVQSSTSRVLWFNQIRAGLKFLGTQVNLPGTGEDGDVSWCLIKNPRWPVYKMGAWATVGQKAFRETSNRGAWWRSTSCVDNTFPTLTQVPQVLWVFGHHGNFFARIERTVKRLPSCEGCLSGRGIPIWAYGWDRHHQMSSHWPVPSWVSPGGKLQGTSPFCIVSPAASMGSFAICLFLRRCVQGNYIVYHRAFIKGCPWSWEVINW